AEQMLSANNYDTLVQSVMGDGLKQGRFTEEDRQTYIEAWSQPGALTGGLNYYRAVSFDQPSDTFQGAMSQGDDLPALMVKVPTLVIRGEQDPFLLTGNLEGLERFVPQLTIKRIPDGTHWVIHEKPALVNSTIREFIEDHLSRSETS